MSGMSGLATGITRAVAFFRGSLTISNDGGLDQLGAILREFSDSVSQFSTLLFKFRNTLNRNCSFGEINVYPQVCQQDYYRTI